MPPTDPEILRTTVDRFVHACRRPALHEPGEELIRLESGNLSLHCLGGRLMLEAWDDRRNLARRVTRVLHETRDRLELEIERFGKRTGTLLLLDMVNPAMARHERRALRGALGERLRLFLSREFAGWKIAELSADPDLEHSLSPCYPRALLRSGSSAWAAIVADPATGGDSANVLTFGLIWLSYLRSRERRVNVEGLAVFVPEGHQQVSALRLRWLDPQLAQYAVYVFNEDGVTQRLQEEDFGNLATRLEPCRAHGRLHGIDGLERLQSLPGVEFVATPGGVLSLRVRGLEFAAVVNGKLLAGIDRKYEMAPGNLDELTALAAELGLLRAHNQRGNPLALRNPEAWLESQVRRHLPELDAALCQQPVYGQLSVMAGMERSVVDLLAVTHEGQLAAIEVKASEDIQLPLQALDYWMRVFHHLEQGDFGAQGYFPGVRVRAVAPRLLLVAPALAFHPTTETLLRFFHPGIEVERFGVGVEWQQRLHVVMRVRGSARPG